MADELPPLDQLKDELPLVDIFAQATQLRWTTHPKKTFVLHIRLGADEPLATDHRTQVMDFLNGRYGSSIVRLQISKVPKGWDQFSDVDAASGTDEHDPVTELRTTWGEIVSRMTDAES